MLCNIGNMHNEKYIFFGATLCIIYSKIHIFLCFLLSVGVDKTEKAPRKTAKT